VFTAVTLGTAGGVGFVKKNVNTPASAMTIDTISPIRSFWFFMTAVPGSAFYPNQVNFGQGHPWRNSPAEGSSISLEPFKRAKAASPLGRLNAETVLSR
jgi:hypothetical protein